MSRLSPSSPGTESLTDSDISASLPTASPVSPRLAVCFCLHDDTVYMDAVVAALNQGFAGAALLPHTDKDIGVPASSPSVDYFAFVGRVPWHGNAGDWESAVRSCEALDMTVVVGDWPGEQEQRQAAKEHLLSRGYTHALIPDGDEIIEPELLQALLKVFACELADRVYVSWDTYWKSPEYVIRPRERFTPCYLIDLRVATPVGGRHFEGGRPLFLGSEHGIVHHLSWVGPEARIKRKLSTWGHANEVQSGWYERVWQAWDSDRMLRNLHPTHPEAYGFAERIAVPDLLLPAWQRYREANGKTAESSGAVPYPPIPARWPKVSVVIPVYGGRDDLASCLDSLAPLRTEALLHEVIVVDNGSPDDDPAFEDTEAALDRYPFVTLLRNDSNLGFARACNQGADSATGDLLLFLNSDTVVPRAGLVRLVESLTRSGSIAATGPYTNRAGHGQQIAPTYTGLSTLSLFAEDFARQDEDRSPDQDTDMLVGFCLLVRRSAWEEVCADGTAAGNGFDERFGLGTFEDNDLCYRLRRLGYRLVRSSRAFVHHAGSKTLTKVQADRDGGVAALLAQNERLYRAKWQQDVETGFASHLSGLAHPGSRILFDPEKHPDLRLKKTRARAKEAGISLCMIVKNEERVLGEALESAKPFFAEMIVVDTGSTDRTVQIAEAAGAKVYHFPWTDSFSEARNESLRHATGKWVFWMDADDTLSFAAGEALIECALSAPPPVMAFVVPVQFVDDGTGKGSGIGGTRVDHVKLFRNLPGLSFEGRIHEQILPSLRKVGTEALGGEIGIVRAPGHCVVLHSGYDTSDAGQARKRERDAKLLALDLAERPNHPFVLFNLGMTDHYGGKHKEAVEWLRKCIQASQSGESHVRKAYALMAVSIRETGDVEGALAAIEEGLSAVGDDPDLHFQAGYTLSHLQRYEEAKAHYQKVLGADISGHFSSIDMSILGYKTLYNLGGVCRMQGGIEETTPEKRAQCYAEAKGWWLRALEDEPSFLPSAFDLFAAAMEQQDWATAERMLVHVESQQGKSLSWATMGSQLAEAREGPTKGAEAATGFLRRIVAACGDSADGVGARLVLARRLLQLAEAGRKDCEAEALPLLHWLQERGVGEAAFYLGVGATRAGAFADALKWMERALSLDPGHVETQQQVENLKRLLQEQ